jgi:hypothetical protein
MPGAFSDTRRHADAKRVLLHRNTIVIMEIGVQTPSGGSPIALRSIVGAASEFHPSGRIGASVGMLLMY